MPTSNTHASPPLTHSHFSLVSLPRASILPENLLRSRSLNVDRAQHEQTCVHANDTTVIFPCLRSEPNECTRFNQSMYRERSVTSYAYEQYSRYPSSDSQICQLGELAERLYISRELVVTQAPEFVFCATWANVCARQQHPSLIPVFATELNECTRFNQSMHRERSTRKHSSNSQSC